MADKILKQQKPDLNYQQLQMLQLFSNPMSEEDFKEIRRTIVKVLSKKIDIEMEELEKEKGWTSKTYEEWGKGHIRISSQK